MLDILIYHHASQSCMGSQDWKIQKKLNVLRKVWLVSSTFASHFHVFRTFFCFVCFCIPELATHPTPPPRSFETKATYSLYRHEHHQERPVFEKTFGNRSKSLQFWRGSFPRHITVLEHFPTKPTTGRLNNVGFPASLHHIATTTTAVSGTSHRHVHVEEVSLLQRPVVWNAMPEGSARMPANYPGVPWK